MYLSKNLKYLRENNGRMSQEALAKAIGITRSAVSSYEDGRAEPKLEVINSIANYFGLSIDQIINVDLAVVGSNVAQPLQGLKKYASPKESRVLTITLDENNNENIEFVSLKNAQQYVHSYADSLFLKDLPKYEIPFLPSGKTYRAFEISGDYMLPFPPNCIVVGEYVQDWNSLPEGEVCVIVSPALGIALREVYNKIEENNSFLFKCSNIAYKPQEIPVQDVVELWKFAAIVSKDIPEEQDLLQELRKAFLRLEDDIREIKLAQKNSKGSDVANR
ncbi:MAG: helix-turn-helix transcriptional regulator [Microscillaceae bacterium]|nr:helix-turn-helix transcriptional regulator [Microscillaceae bacterium]MDW8460605.1 helix-turn-helix transcriptional regulator [Cytophagales bacterium]